MYWVVPRAAPRAVDVTTVLCELDRVLSCGQDLASARAGEDNTSYFRIFLAAAGAAATPADAKGSATTRQNFATTGNVHWDDATDARLLCDALDIGFFMFADRLQAAGTRCLCPLDLLRGDFPFFINLCWNEPVHFRAAEFRNTNGNDFRMCYAQAEIPDFLRAQYNDANVRAPIAGAAVPM